MMHHPDGRGRGYNDMRPKGRIWNWEADVWELRVGMMGMESGDDVRAAGDGRTALGGVARRASKEAVGVVVRGGIWGKKWR